MEDFNLINEAGNQKINFSETHPFKFFLKSILAGNYLGIAMILSLSLASLLYSLNANIAKIGYSTFFGLTFVLIIFLNGELFTGNCLTTIFPFFTKEQSFIKLIKTWILSFVGNSIGASWIALLFIKSESLGALVNPYILSLIDAKLEVSSGTLLIRSILCNFIVCIATYVALKVTNEMAKVFIMLIVVATFVAPGFDHCIANIGLYIMGLSLNQISLSDLMIKNVIVSIIGNIIGGSLMLGVPLFWILNKKNDELISLGKS